MRTPKIGDRVMAIGIKKNAFTVSDVDTENQLADLKLIGSEFHERAIPWGRLVYELLTSRPNMAEAMFSAALWAVSKVIRLAGPAIEASHPASVLRTLRDKPPTSVRNFVTDCIDASLATVL
jgi:hypothetical protein